MEIKLAKSSSGCSSNSTCAASSAACRARLEQQRQLRLPAFRIWQARQLVSRDILMSFVLLFIYVIYLHRTVPHMCNMHASCAADATAPELQRLDQKQQCQQPDEALSWAWDLVCGSMLPTRQQARTPQPVQGHVLVWPFKLCAWIAFKALRTCIRALFTFFGCGLLSKDPFQIILPPLRSSILLFLVVPFPYPNLAVLAHRLTTPASSSNSNRGSYGRFIAWYQPCFYWQHPQIRWAAVAMQRVVACIAAAACCGATPSPYFAATLSIWYWQGAAKYIFQGVVGWGLLLPVKLHLLVALCEWILTYTTSIKVQAVYYSTPDSSSSGQDMYLDAWHLLMSLMYVVVMPTLGVLWFERSQLAAYRRLQQEQRQTQHTTTAAAATVAAGSGMDDADSSSSSCCSRSSDTDAECCKGGSTAIRTMTTHAAAAVGDDITGMVLKQAAAALRCGSASTDSAAAAAEGAVAAAPAAAAALSKFTPVDMLPSLQVVFGEEAADVFSAAAAAAAAAGPLGMPTYTSMAANMPVSIKVHTTHSDIGLVEPLLYSSLAAQVSYITSSSSSSGSCAYDSAEALQLWQAACFEGCVQMVATVYTLSNNSSSSSRNEGSSSMAEALLADVSKGLSQRDNAAGTDASNAHRSGSQQTLDISQIGTDDQPSTTLDSNNSQHMRSNDQQRMGKQQARTDVVVGTSVAATNQGSDQLATVAADSSSFSCSSSSSMPGKPIALQHCSPPCLVADKAQQLLQLQLHQLDSSNPSTPVADCASGFTNVPDQAAAAAARRYKLVAYNHTGVVLNEDVHVNCHGAISIALPAMPQGVLQLALLQASSQAPGCTEPAAATAPQSASDAAVPESPTSITVSTTNMSPRPVHVDDITTTPDTEQPGVNTVSQSSATTAAAAAFAPLVTVSLLVLPEAVAHELEAFWQQAAHSTGSNNDSNSSSSSVWQKCVVPVTRDVAYVLLACQKAAAAAAAESPAVMNCNSAAVAVAARRIPESVRQVLVPLLTHLMACNLWRTMQFLLDTVAAATPSTNTAAGSHRTAAAVISAAHVDDELAHQHDSAGCSRCQKLTDGNHIDTPTAAAAAEQQTLLKPQLSSCSSISFDTPLSAHELLWGFKHPDRESQYQASAFTSTALIDFVSLAYTTLLGIGIYIPAWTASDAQISPMFLIWSHVLCAVVGAAGPFAVWMLHWHVTQQTSQLQQSDAMYVSQGSGTWPAAATAQGSGSMQLHVAKLAAAGRLKQKILSVWMMCVVAWGCMVLSGCGVVAEPVAITKAWSSRSFAHDVGCMLGLAVRGWTTGQAPFQWSVPLISAETILNMAGSYKHGLPLPRLLPRYLPGFLLSVTIMSMHHVQGRRHFCARHGLEVADRLT